MSLSTLNFGHSTAFITNHVLQNTTITGCACVGKKRPPGTNKYEVVMPNKSEFGFKFKIGGRRAALTVIDSVVYARTGGQAGLGVVRKTHVTNTDITCNCNKKQVMHIGIDHKGELDHFNLSSAEDTLGSSIPPTGPKWTKIAPMKISREGPGLAELKGKVYAVGGSSSSRTLKSSEVYDPASNSWSTIADMSMARYNMDPTVLIDAEGRAKIYVVGGSDGTTNLKSGESFDPSTMSWSPIPDMSTVRHNMELAVLNGKIYVVGGASSTANLKSGEAFDPIAATWSPIPDMSMVRMYSGLAALNGKIYAVGGYDGAITVLKSGEVYDPASNSWSTIANMISERSNMNIAVLNGKIYVVGGNDVNHNLKSGEVYDPDSNKWSSIADMSMVRVSRDLAVLNGKIYVVGGLDGTTNLKSGEVYDPVSNSWSPIADMSIARNDMGFGALNGKIYAVGGYMSGSMKSAEVYVPPVFG